MGRAFVHTPVATHVLAEHNISYFQIDGENYCTLPKLNFDSEAAVRVTWS
jgi:hypothetical protein